MSELSGGQGTGPATSEGPWATSWYEQRRFDLVAAMLPREFYRHVFDPACGTGELSAAIAARCEYLLATDRNAEHVQRARERLAGFNTDVEVRDVRDEWPEQRYDLVVLCEVLPYLTEEEADAVVRRALGHLVPHGHLVIGQWRCHLEGTRLSGDDISARVKGLPATRLLACYQDPDYVIDVLGHEGALTPAEEEGLLGHERPVTPVDDEDGMGDL